jgi:hypothetical protein
VLLLPTAALAGRRALVAPGGPLAPTADALAADLAPALGRPVWLPAEKARLSRTGGRCPRDGTLLTFDPYAPRRHACPRCGGSYDDEAHYRWWVMGYQLWLAERAVHAAVLYALRGDPAHATFAAAVLDAQADAYPRYPNTDNVLGPSRPFFSTYLESLWLLHVCVALDALRAARATGVQALAGRVKDRVVAPSRALVASYDEGASNRQVWNGAACLAASQLLGDAKPLARRARPAPYAVPHTFDRAGAALLADGTWYEGDNYHQFAHRGLWYVLRLADGRAEPPPPELARRFALGFATPFRAAFPDLTLPARRDAQYGVTLRQWRWAEWCELGLAWPGADDATRRTLGGALAALYAPSGAARGDTGRWRSTGESERNERPVRLDRAALGWKALLFAEPEAAVAAAEPPRSVLLADQGLAVFRRDGGRLWAGLDFGASTGGGHGHPDRLNVLLADGPVRWLDDMGTGSYTERALHWYRSTLAHQAPLVDGRSQPRVAGRLRAYDEQPPFGWADASADLAPGLRAVRALVAGPDYVVHALTWTAESPATVDLPFHVEADVEPGGPWVPATLVGAGGLEDGFDFLRDVEALGPAVGPRVRLRARGAASGAATGPEEPTLDGWIEAGPGGRWFRARAPGPPGAGERRFLMLRAYGRAGSAVAVWSPRGAVRDVIALSAPSGGDVRLAVRRADGSTDQHQREGGRWTVERRGADGRVAARIVLAGRRAGADAASAQAPDSAVHEVREAAVRLRRWSSRSRVRDAAGPPTGDADLMLRADGHPAVVRLGKSDYRRSERSWIAAGRPRAEVRVGAAVGVLALDVAVRLGRRAHLRGPDRGNDMDNERADVNADGVQLYLRPDATEVTAGWLLVPGDADGTVRVTPLDAAAARLAPRLDVRWAPELVGWRLGVRVPLAVLAPGGLPATVGLDVLVNETPPARERRQGQLVLSGAPREFVYLRGDRSDGPGVRVWIPAAAAG